MRMRKSNDRSTRPDLTFTVAGDRVPRVGGVPLGDRRVPLPWPMTRTGGLVYLLCEFAVILAGIAGALWLGTRMFDPSPLRLLPAVLLVLAVKFVITPAIGRAADRQRQTDGEG